MRDGNSLIIINKGEQRYGKTIRSITSTQPRGMEVG
jgi:hypothetical protein